MAWPKLRNRSSGPLMTASNRSGGAHDGARSHGGAPQGASGGSARGSAEPVLEAPAAWPGPVEDEAGAEAGLAEVTTADVAAADVAAAEAAAAEAAAAEAAAAEPESADLLLWDWSPPGEPVPDDLTDELAAQQADPPRSEWKLVVTPVEEVNGATGTQRPGIGQRRGNLAHLATNPRMRIWRLRVVVAVLILLAFSILVSWQFGLTLAVIVVIADIIYRSRRGHSGRGTARLTGAQRAARLIGYAERIAQSITNKYWKASALAEVAAALAATDPDRAEHIARSITDEFWKARALVMIAEA